MATVTTLTAQAADYEKTVKVPAKPGKAVATYAGHAPFNNDSDGLVYGQLGLDDPTEPCTPGGATGDLLNDQHKIKLTVPKISSKYDYVVRFQIDWKPLANESAADMALYIYGPDGKLVAASDGSSREEGVNIPGAKPGVYNALVCAFQTGPNGQDYTGKVSAFTTAQGTFPKAKGVKAPSYKQFSAPKGVADDAGEPSIGNNWKSGKTLYLSYTDVYDVRFNDKKGTSTWTVVNDDAADPSNKISLDPILYTDSKTGRTFVSQLYLACSAMGYSDDDFTSPVQISEGCGSVINGADHQTVGGGPYPQGVVGVGGTLYPHAVYYCAQGIAVVGGSATCARSDDGGRSFLPGIQVWQDECTGIHGHIKVAPDGTAYLPDDNCGGKQGVAVSTDGGLSWTIRQVPDSLAGSSDPSIGIGSDNTVYYGYSDGTGQARIAVSRDRGAHWTKSVNVGIPFGIHNTEFAEVVAGDGDRASFAFLGTPTKGNTQPSSFGKDSSGQRFVGGEWHLYVSTTYDRGKHWTTVDATPKDPVQRGCIWNGGGGEACRNLLDFNDITVDKTGHVMVGFADGCLPPKLHSASNCVSSKDVSANKLQQHGAIVRQVGGKGLFKKYDAANAKAARAVSIAAPTTSTGVASSKGTSVRKAPAKALAPARAAAPQAAPSTEHVSFGRTAGGVSAVLLLLLAVGVLRRRTARS